MFDPSQASPRTAAHAMVAKLQTVNRGEAGDRAATFVRQAGRTSARADRANVSDDAEDEQGERRPDGHGERTVALDHEGDDAEDESRVAAPARRARRARSPAGLALWPEARLLARTPSGFRTANRTVGVSRLPLPRARQASRLLYVVTLAEVGGAQSYVRDLLAGDARGVRRDRCGARRRPVAGRGGRARDSRSCRCGTSDARSRSIHDPLGLFELTRLFRRVRPDVVHLNSSKAGILGRIAAARRARPGPRLHRPRLGVQGDDRRLRRAALSRGPTGPSGR